MVKKLGKVEGPSRTATLLMACGLSAAVMLVSVLWHLSILAEAAIQSALFIAAWMFVFVAGTCTLILVRKCLHKSGEARALYVLLATGMFIFFATVLALMVSPWPLSLFAGDMFDGGDYGVHFAVCLVLFAAGASWDPLSAKYRHRPRKVTAVRVQDSSFGRGDDFSYETTSVADYLTPPPQQ